MIVTFKVFTVTCVCVFVSVCNCVCELTNLTGDEDGGQNHNDYCVNFI